MYIDRDETNIIVLSRNRWGKTTLVKNILAKLPAYSAIIMDTHNEYRIPQWTYNPHNVYGVMQLDRFIKYVTDNNKQFKHKLVVIDDIDVYKPTRSEQFYNYAISNAHYKNGVILIARRAIWLPKIIIGNANYIIFSGAVPPEDIAYLQKCGISKSIVQKSYMLQPHEFFCYDTINREIEKMVTHV